jgi:predicted acyltransferase
LATLSTVKASRLLAIDAFRGIVMVLMIFVNDLWTLIDIPGWLSHVAAGVSGMGLADVVFPAFLFIVGLSVPYAIESRQKKGESSGRLFLHLLSRSFALLVMGFFYVNLESYNSEARIPRPLWQLLITLSFFLIWLDYSQIKPVWKKVLQPSGFILLFLLALLYESPAGKGVFAMKPHWWGILGLIGWAYLISSSIYLFSKGKLWMQVLALLFFMTFNVAANLNWLPVLKYLSSYIWEIQNGAMPALTIAGIITAQIYRKYTANDKNFWFLITAIAVILLVFGFSTAALWGISKNNATPSWVGICAGISVIAFGLMVWITEISQRKKWYNLIKPAGTSTLTCYLIPYIYYSLFALFSLPQLPVMLRTGSIGLLKSLVFALMIVTLTGWLGRIYIRLKL